MSFKLTTTASVLAAGFALAVGAPSVAFAGDAAKEVSAAGMHAGMGATATNIETAHAHLHHTLNCLVGPKGEGFDAKQMNPCAQMGDGAIPDSSDAAAKKKLGDAAMKAGAGLKSDDLAVATKAAGEVAAELK